MSFNTLVLRSLWYFSPFILSFRSTGKAFGTIFCFDQWGLPDWTRYSCKSRRKKATVCIESAYEFPIVTVDKEGRSAVTRVPVGGIRGVACMGKCPCSSFLWIKPLVTVSSKATWIPRVVKNPCKGFGTKR